MFRIASVSQSALCQSVVSQSVASESVVSSLRQSRSVASADVIPFPARSQSEDGDWQSVGEAAMDVLRRLRPANEQRVSVESVKVAS